MLSRCETSEGAGAGRTGTYAVREAGGRPLKGAGYDEKPVRLAVKRVDPPYQPVAKMPNFARKVLSSGDEPGVLTVQRGGEWQKSPWPVQ